MRIGILGAGQVGGRLGRVWAGAGHEIVFGLHEPAIPEARKRLSDQGPGTHVTTVSEAAQASEVVVVATPWPVTRQAISQAGNLAGKIVVDCTNPLLPDLSGLDLESGTSAAEEMSRWAPGSRVVKAFNTVAASTIGNALCGQTILPCFYCGDDVPAKAIIRELVTCAGFEPLDVGSLDKARMLEAFALFYIHLAVKCDVGGEFALAIVRS